MLKYTGVLLLVCCSVNDCTTYKCGIRGRDAQCRSFTCAVLLFCSHAQVGSDTMTGCKGPVAPHGAKIVDCKAYCMQTPGCRSFNQWPSTWCVTRNISCNLIEGGVLEASIFAYHWVDSIDRTRYGVTCGDIRFCVFYGNVCEHASKCVRAL